MRSGPKLLATMVIPLAMALPGLPAAAYAPESTPDRRIQGASLDAAAHPAARGARMAVMIMRGGTPVIGRNAQATMIPASLMKLATTAAAVDKFGADHRFVTRVDSSGGTASRPSSLYLIGGGDSTLATNYYRRERFMPDPDDEIQRPAFASGSPTVEQLAARIKAADVTRVTGNLIVDESWFDNDRYPEGWPSRYFGYDPESGKASALLVNEARTNPERTAADPDPAMQAGRELRKALSARGISIAGNIRRGKTPSSARSVTSISSPPLSEIVDFINRYSANFQAEILFKALGAEVHGRGTYENGARAVRASLNSMGVNTKGLKIYGGSGLSRSDQATARTIADILNAILERPSLRAVRRSIPVAGQPGTMQKRLNSEPTKNNLRGKTGYLSGVRGLAGWVTGPDGTNTVYVALYNGASSALALTSPLDIFARAMAFYPSS